MMLSLKKMADTNAIRAPLIPHICVGSLKLPLFDGFSTFVSGWLFWGGHVIKYGKVKYVKSNDPTIEFDDCDIKTYMYLICA